MESRYRGHTVDNSPVGLILSETSKTLQTIIEDKDEDPKVVAAITNWLNQFETHIYPFLRHFDNGGSPQKEQVDALYHVITTEIIEVASWVHPSVKLKGFDPKTVKLSGRSQEKIDALTKKILSILWSREHLESLIPFLNPISLSTMLDHLPNILPWPLPKPTLSFTPQPESGDEKQERRPDPYWYEGKWMGQTISFSLEDGFQKFRKESLTRTIVYDQNRKAVNVMTPDPEGNIRFLSILAQVKMDALVNQSAGPVQSLIDNICLQIKTLADISVVMKEYDAAFNHQALCFPKKTLSDNNKTAMYSANKEQEIKQRINDLLSNFLQEESDDPATEKARLVSDLHRIKSRVGELPIPIEFMKEQLPDFYAQIEKKIAELDAIMAKNCNPDIFINLEREVTDELEKNRQITVFLRTHFPEEKEFTIEIVQSKIVEIDKSLQDDQRLLGVLIEIKNKIAEYKDQASYFPFLEIDKIVKHRGYEHHNKIGVVWETNKFFQKEFSWLLETLGLIQADASSISLPETEAKIDTDTDTDSNYPLFLETLGLMQADASPTSLPETEAKIDTDTDSKYPREFLWMISCRHRQSWSNTSLSMNSEQYEQIKNYLNEKINSKIQDIEKKIETDKATKHTLQQIKDGQIKPLSEDEQERLVRQQEHFKFMKELLNKFKTIFDEFNLIQCQLDEASLCDTNDLLTRYSRLTDLNTQLACLNAEAKAYQISAKETLSVNDRSALASLLEKNNPTEALQQKVIEKCQENWKAFFDAAQKNLEQWLAPKFAEDGTLLLFLDNDMNSWLVSYKNFPEEKVSAKNTKDYIRIKDDRETSYNVKLVEQTRRLNQIKALRGPLIEMYKKGKELIDKERKEDGESFQALALELVDMSNKYIGDVTMTQDQFCRSLSDILSSEKVTSIKNNRIWPIVVGNILVACLTVGLSLPIQVGMYLHSGYVLFSKTDREYKIDAVKEVIKPWQPPDAKT